MVLPVLQALEDVETSVEVPLRAKALIDAISEK
jgi:hypothetical protein